LFVSFISSCVTDLSKVSTVQIRQKSKKKVEVVAWALIHLRKQNVLLKMVFFDNFNGRKSAEVWQSEISVTLLTFINCRVLQRRPSRLSPSLFHLLNVRDRLNEFLMENR